ncbi:Protein IscX, believed to be involved in assembly of Fe-S clusters [hydrothermal vent metagenome]|uniref:Protein IscX, believed to be involved in assembly of Fe-S clusters n=1 Tax=hydrothermal vent metagenome TaxID=652676 RepID=A0A3B0WAZ0_9ZZZZ
MILKWVDSLEIAIELYEKFPDVDPKFVNFVELRQWVIDLKDFDDDPEHSGERILEAIQLAWIEEKED